MKSIALFFSFFPVLAWAHIEDGLWKGVDSNGQACEMNVAQNYFENNMPHPLNERIKVMIGSEEFVLRHPPVINLTEKVAAFDHDVFESIVPNSKGAKALVVKMNHTPGSEGPTEYHVISHEYRADRRSVTSCTALKFVN